MPADAVKSHTKRPGGSSGTLLSTPTPSPPSSSLYSSSWSPSWSPRRCEISGASWLAIMAGCFAIETEKSQPHSMYTIFVQCMPMMVPITGLHLRSTAATESETVTGQSCLVINHEAAKTGSGEYGRRGPHGCRAAARV